MIIETCPKCGHDLMNIQIDVMPPIRRKECTNCGWSWESEPGKIIRVPFGEPKHLDIYIRRLQDEKTRIPQNFKISLTDDTGKIKDLVTIIGELADVWDKMGWP